MYLPKKGTQYPALNVDSGARGTLAAEVQIVTVHIDFGDIILNTFLMKLLNSVSAQA